MINKNKLGIIDSQDAIIGNPLYDVSSLIDDVRIKLPNKLQNQSLDLYHKNSKLKLSLNIITKANKSWRITE